MKRTEDCFSTKYSTTSAFLIALVSVVFAGQANTLANVTGEFSHTDIGNPPDVDDADAAYLGPGSDSSGNEGHLYGDRPAMGQTFTTGSNAGGYELNAVTYRSGTFGVLGGGPALFSIQVGTISGNALSPIMDPVEVIEESDGQHLGINRHLTVSFDSPMTLIPNTLYGIDWYGGTSIYGIVLQQTNNNDFSNGQAYTSGSLGNPDNNNLTMLDFDRAFHFDIVAVPEPATITLCLAVLTSLGLWRRPTDQQHGFLPI